jgi:hypothetical protein
LDITNFHASWLPSGNDPTPPTIGRTDKSSQPASPVWTISNRQPAKKRYIIVLTFFRNPQSGFSKAPNSRSGPKRSLPHAEWDYTIIF